MQYSTCAASVANTVETVTPTGVSMSTQPEWLNGGKYVYTTRTVKANSGCSILPARPEFKKPRRSSILPGQRGGGRAQLDAWVDAARHWSDWVQYSTCAASRYKHSGGPSHQRWVQYATCSPTVMQLHNEYEVHDVSLRQMRPY